MPAAPADVVVQVVLLPLLVLLAIISNILTIAKITFDMIWWAIGDPLYRISNELQRHSLLPFIFNSLD